MEITDYLSEQADEIAATFKSKQSALESEIFELNRKLQQCHATMDSVRMTRQRLLDFRPSLGGKFQCPRCFIVDNLAADLRMTGLTGGDGVLKCNNCQAEFPIP